MSDNNAETLEQVRDNIKELDQRRNDLERDVALFAPQRQRLERGRKALELWDSYAALRALRQTQDQDRAELAELREDTASARSALKSTEESCSLMETEFRERLTEQKRLFETAQKVQELDTQLAERLETAAELRAKIDKAGKEQRECETRVDSGQSGLEKIGIAIREARKYLQANAIDERLIAGLAGIQKCFGLFVQAKDKREALKEAYSNAIRKSSNLRASSTTGR